MRHTKLFGAGFGDILRRPKLGVKHLGVYLGNGLVLHNSPDKGEHISDVNGFASGHEIETIPTPPHIKVKIMEGVQNTLRNPRRYDAATNNCEHTVTRIVEGHGYSPTVLVVGLAALVIVGIAVSRGR